jgi:hypothetical protein
MSKKHMKNMDFYKIASGIVGTGSALEFMGFLDRTQKAIAPEDIIKNPHKAKFPSLSDIDALHATMESLGWYIKNDKPEEWEAALIYATRDDHPLAEIAIILTATVVDAIINHLDEDKRLDAFNSQVFEKAHDKYGKYITAMNCR